MSLDSFHHWLRSACPADSATLLRELEIGHRSSKEAYAGLPRNSAELSEALRALEVRGLLRKDGAEWRWLSEKAKAEPQGVLFGGLK